MSNECRREEYGVAKWFGGTTEDVQVGVAGGARSIFRRTEPKRYVGIKLVSLARDGRKD